MRTREQILDDLSRFYTERGNIYSRHERSVEWEDLTEKIERLKAELRSLEEAA